eukprot:scaffold35516_cov44-Prasinocladus_malaysianus.AAC.1
MIQPLDADSEQASHPIAYPYRRGCEFSVLPQLPRRPILREGLEVSSDQVAIRTVAEDCIYSLDPIMSLSGGSSTSLEDLEGVAVVGEPTKEITDAEIKRGFGLPFFRIVTSGMHNFFRIRKVMAGGDIDIHGWKVVPRADISYHVSMRKEYTYRHVLPPSVSTPCQAIIVHDRLGDFVLSESKAVLRRDFRANVKGVGMTVRCEAGCGLNGK